MLVASSPQEARNEENPQGLRGDRDARLSERPCLHRDPRPEGEGVRQGPDVTGRHFRVSGPKDLMKIVKEHNGHLVEVVGLIRKSALSDSGIGMKVGGTRVVIGAPGTDPDRSMYNHPVAQRRRHGPDVDWISVERLSDRLTRCPS